MVGESNPAIISRGRNPLNVCISQELERPLLTPATKAFV